MGFDTQDFSTGAPALGGQAVADLSAWAAFLPTPGTGGLVYAGDGMMGPATLIGEFAVIPEPAVAGLLGMGGLPALFRLRRRR
jgi:hypothetical protein